MNRIVIFLLFAIGFSLYANTLYAPFHFDDHDLILNNSNIRVTPDIMAIFHSPGNKMLSYLTFHLNYRFGGDNTLGYHIVNVTLHILASLSLYFVILLIFRTPHIRTSSLMGQKKLFAAMSSIFFLVHPLQTQAVSYIWERTEVLSAVFFLSSYMSYLVGRLKHKTYFYFLSLALFYTGISAKETILSLPAIIILSEIVFFGSLKPETLMALYRKNRKMLIIVVLMITLLFYKILTLPRIYHFLSGQGDFAYAKAYLFTQFRVVLQYIKLCFFPIGQNLDYHFILSPSFFHFSTVASFGVLLTILIIAWKLSKNQPLMSFGIFFFFICLLPSSSIIPSPTVIFEHRVYLSMAGFSIFTAALLFMWLQNKTVKAITFAITTIVFSSLTISRNFTWQSQIGLMEDTVKKSPLNARPHLILGGLYYKAGNTAKTFDLFKRASELAPQYPDAHNNLGLMYAKTGNTGKAEKEFRKALEIKPNYFNATINLANILIEKQDLEQAYLYLKKAGKQHKVRRKDKMLLWLALGNYHQAKGQLHKAEYKFFGALDLHEENQSAHFNLGNLYYKMKLPGKALRHYKAAIKKSPYFVDAYINLGILYYETKDLEKARKCFENALRIDPTRPDTYRNLANVYHSLKQHKKAEIFYRKSITLHRRKDPDR